MTEGQGQTLNQFEQALTHLRNMLLQEQTDIAREPSVTGRKQAHTHSCPFHKSLLEQPKATLALLCNGHVVPWHCQPCSRPKRRIE